MLDALHRKEKSIAVIGLGYVGLPVALSMGRHFDVIGFDIDARRTEQLKEGIDPSDELPPEEFEGCDVQFTHREKDLGSADFFIITVPTPIDEHRVPDLSALFEACESVGNYLKPGSITVIESTVYPTCVEDECVPVLEQYSGLSRGADFGVGYSPERINPGDTSHRFENILKIVSADSPEHLETISGVYEQVVEAGIYRAPSIQVAEAAKVIENAQRDLNIAFVNELSMIFDKLDLDTRDVLDAAATKWNFIPFEPGLVGGHCIGVDPYYLVHKARSIGYDPEVMLSGRSINDGMSGYVAKKLIQELISKDKSPQNTRVLILGITFKENVSDIRNSRIVQLVRELNNFGVKVEIYDPLAHAEDVEKLYSMNLLHRPGSDYDAVVVAVRHDEFKTRTARHFEEMMNDDPILFDLKGMYRRNEMKGLNYWRM